jgi:tetratricopeptide (TPR) repeat protein
MAKKNNTVGSGKTPKIYFRIMTVVFSLFILLMIELLLRAFSYGSNMHLFEKHPHKDYKTYYRVNPSIGEKYFTKFDATGATNDIFLRKKPENGFRIFVIGSSTVVGFPYENNLMFSRILQKRLQDAYPDKTIEVVNTAITAVNTITFCDYMKEIVRYSPDAILFYEGHNEFYGAFGIGSNEAFSQHKFIRNLHFKLMNLRIYQLMRSCINSVSAMLSHKPDLKNSRGSLMKKMVADKNIDYHGEKYQLGLEQFRSNLSEILQRASNRKIPVFLSDLICNVKDLPPFGSTDSDKYPRADEVFKQANEALSTGDTSKARDLFYLAKDLDPVRFRASEEINGIIDSLANSYHCYLVPMKSRFMQASKGGLIGNNILMEHVHPNIDGQFLMADAFFNKIVESKLIAGETSPYTTYSFDYYRRNWGYTKLDSLMGAYRINQLKSYWPFNSFENNITYRDTLKIHSVVDSIAFKAITSSFVGGEKLHGALAEYYLENGDNVKALKEYEALICTNPYWYEYYNKAANILLKLDDLYKAEIYLKKSVGYKKTSIALIMLADIETIKHNFAEASEDLGYAYDLAENKDTKLLILNKSYMVCYYMNDRGKANLFAEKITKLGGKVTTNIPTLGYQYSTYLPFDVKPMLLQAIQKLEESKIDEALSILVSSLEINNAPVTNRLIGNVLITQKDNRLLYYYIKAYPTFRFEPSFLSKYSIANYVNRRYPEAKKALSDLKQIQPDYPEIPGLEKLLRGK